MNYTSISTFTYVCMSSLYRNNVKYKCMCMYIFLIPWEYRKTQLRIVYVLLSTPQYYRTSNFPIDCASITRQRISRRATEPTSAFIFTVTSSSRLNFTVVSSRWSSGSAIKFMGHLAEPKIKTNQIQQTTRSNCFNFPT